MGYFPEGFICGEGRNNPTVEMGSTASGCAGCGRSRSVLCSAVCCVFHYKVVGG